MCAWCNQKISDGSADSIEVSHGICRPCRNYFFSEGNRTLDKVLNCLDAPVIVVDQNAEVVSANDEALKVMDQDLEAVKGLKGGDAMECTYARLPEGCGNTIHCTACTVRGNVMKTFEEGKSLKKVPAILNRRKRESNQRIRFLISTEKINDVVLLKIEEIEAD